MTMLLAFVWVRVSRHIFSVDMHCTCRKDAVSDIVFVYILSRILRKIGIVDVGKMLFE